MISVYGVNMPTVAKFKSCYYKCIKASLNTSVLTVWLICCVIFLYPALTLLYWIVNIFLNAVLLDKKRTGQQVFTAWLILVLRPFYCVCYSCNYLSSVSLSVLINITMDLVVWKKTTGLNWITGLQTSNYDIFAKLSQLDLCKPIRLPPYCLLIMSLQETGGKITSTAAIRSRTSTSTIIRCSS